MHLRSTRRLILRSLQHLCAFIKAAHAQPLRVHSQRRTRIRIDPKHQRKAPELAVYALFQLLVELIILGLVYQIAFRQFFLDADIADLVRPVDEIAAFIVELDHSKVDILAIMVNAYHIVLVQHIMQTELIHALISAADDPDLVAVIVRLLDIGQLLGVLMEKIALGKGPVKGLFEHVFVPVACLPVERRAIPRRHIRHIGRFFHTTFNFE